MTTHHEFQIQHDHIAKNIQQALNVLTGIPESFPNKELRVIDYNKQCSKNKMVEIDLVAATLTCLLNEDGICNNAYLFLDDLDDLQRYIDYCEDTYKFDYAYGAWKTEKGCIYVGADGRDCYLTLRSFNA